jgi:hypothetical protein
MLSLLFILAVTGVCIFISYSIRGTEAATWFDYYKGGVIGLFVSGAILHFVNKRRFHRELKESNRPGKTRRMDN